jgi:hypothetical protein
MRCGRAFIAHERLAESPDHISIEVRENDEVLFVVGRSDSV